MRNMGEWLPILLSFYPALSRRTPTLVYGSQILSVVTGIDVSSKDIDLLSPNVTLSQIEDAYRESSDKEEFRIELLKTRRGRVFTLYYPSGSRPIPIEIFTTTPLGDPLPTFSDHVVEVERWNVRFLSLSVEAYLVLEAARGARSVSLERFRRVEFNRNSALSLAKRLGVEEEVLHFLDLLEGGEGDRI